jgi:hypothetical protein
MNSILLRTRTLTAALALALLLPLGTGCDTSVDLGLTAQFFVGNWQMQSVHDQNGERNRTTEVRQVVNDLRVTFNADNSFALLVDYQDVTGQEDRTIIGTYSVTPTGQLVLTSAGLAIPFDAVAQGNDRVELRASAAVVAAVLALTEVDLGLTGTVVLTMQRGGPGA